MLLLTGATGLVGSALLPRLIRTGQPVRCLVRDPRRLGPQRVRVQIALGDLADPPSFRNALRGVDTVVHLAGSIRDQAVGSIEELNGIATWRMVESAQRAGVGHFVFLSVLDASTHHRARLLRAKAVAERAVLEADLRSTVFAPSLVYAPGDRWLTLLERLSLLPAVPLCGRQAVRWEPIWAQDVADCLLAVLAPSRRAETGTAARERFELAGPQALTQADIARAMLRANGRRRTLVGIPTPLISRALRALETLAGSRAVATWDEAELLQVPLVSRRGVGDARGLGVNPLALAAVLENAQRSGAPATPAPGLGAARQPTGA